MGSGKLEQKREVVRGQQNVTGWREVSTVRTVRGNPITQRVGVNNAFFTRGAYTQDYTQRTHVAPHVYTYFVKVAHVDELFREGADRVPGEAGIDDDEDDADDKAGEGEGDGEGKLDAVVVEDGHDGTYGEDAGVEVDDIAEAGRVNVRVKAGRDPSGRSRHWNGPALDTVRGSILRRCCDPPP